MKTDNDMRNILIIEVNWLGDTLFSTPFIKAIRKKFPQAHIACMVAPRCREILEYNPHINEIIVYDEKGIHKSIFGKLRLVRLLRKKEFDMAILLHRSFTRTLMAYLSGIPRRVGYITAKRRKLLTHPVEPPDTALHKVEYFLRIAEFLGCDVSDKGYEFFITDKERESVEKALAQQGISKKDLLVAIHPGANWLPKRWSEKNFAIVCDTLIEKYGVKVVATGASKDLPIAERIRGIMRQNLVVFSGKTDLKELAALMERADFVISGDSGPMHIAVSMKTNVMALFGPTSTSLTGPYGDGNYRVIQRDVGCEIPCYDFTCGNYRCMEAIKAQDVLGVFEEMHVESMIAGSRSIKRKQNTADSCGQ